MAVSDDSPRVTATVRLSQPVTRCAAAAVCSYADSRSCPSILRRFGAFYLRSMLMTEFNTLINNLANPHGKAFSLKKLAIVVSSILDTTFLIYSVNSLLAGDVKSKTICFLCKLESCCSSAIISLLRTFCAFELYIIILFTYQYTRSNIC